MCLRGPPGPNSPGSLVSLADLRSALADGVPAGASSEDSVRRQWWAALATLQDPRTAQLSIPSDALVTLRPGSALVVLAAA